MLRPL
ncbi:hypothetical protein VTH06DRAFT_4642 [Thermothelomyces fergusii]